MQPIGSRKRHREFNPFSSLVSFGKREKEKKSNHFFCVVQITDGRMELCYLLLLPVEDGMFDPVAATASFYCHLVDSRRPCEGKNTKAFWDWSEMRPSAAAGCFSPLCCFSIIFRFTVLTVTCFFVVFLEPFSSDDVTCFFFLTIVFAFSQMNRFIL